MKEIICIELQNVRFHAYHGFHSQEQKTGNEFEVNLRVETIPSSGTITGIKETVNYATLFEIVKNEMQHPRELLETLVMETAERIHQDFPSVKRITISIAKLNPPIRNFNGQVSVSYTREN